MHKIKTIFLSSVFMYKNVLLATPKNCNSTVYYSEASNLTNNLTEANQSNDVKTNSASTNSSNSSSDSNVTSSSSNGNSTIKFSIISDSSSKNQNKESLNEPIYNVQPIAKKKRQKKIRKINVKHIDFKQIAEKFQNNQTDIKKKLINQNKTNIITSPNSSNTQKNSVNTFNQDFINNFITNLKKTNMHNNDNLEKSFDIKKQDIYNNFIQNLFTNNKTINKVDLNKINYYESLKIQEMILTQIFNSYYQEIKNNHENLKLFFHNCLENLKNSKNDKDSNSIFILNLFENLKKQLDSFLFSIDSDLDKLLVSYKIDFFNILLQNTKDDFKEDILKEKIKDLWAIYREEYFNKQSNINLSNEKSNKNINIKDFNNLPIDFQEDVLSIVDYSCKTTKKMSAIVSLIDSLKNINTLCNSDNPDLLKPSLNFLSTLQQTIEAVHLSVQNIEIDSSLPNITSSINNLYTALNDLLSTCFLVFVSIAENDHNAKNPGFFKFFRRSFSTITNAGLLSMMNVLMFKNYSNNFIHKYSLSAHDWYSSNYRIPSIINTMSTENKNNIINLLNLQKSMIIKLIETFNHNYQSKILLTKNDYTHIKKLLSQLQIIMNMLTALKAVSEHTTSSPKVLEDLRFNLYSVSDDLKYIKRNSYNPNEVFFVAKKIKESDSIKILTSEKNNDQLKLLTKILYEFFYNNKKFIKTCEEDPKDLQNNNLFDIKTDHFAFLNKN